MDRDWNWRTGLSDAANVAQVVSVVGPIFVAVILWLLGVGVPGLVAALAMSVAANAGLGLAWLRTRRALGRALGQLRADDPLPSPWIPDPSDILRWTVTHDTLEEGFTRAEAHARKVLAEDAVVHFESFTILPRAHLRFRAYSEIAAKRCSIAVHPTEIEAGDRASGSGWGSFDKSDKQQEVWPGPETPPWRGDPSWEHLVRLSWLRVRPFVGRVVLEAGAHAIADEGWSRWSICYQRARAEGEAPLPSECFSLHDERLEGIAS